MYSTDGQAVDRLAKNMLAAAADVNGMVDKAYLLVALAGIAATVLRGEPDEQEREHHFDSFVEAVRDFMEAAIPSGPPPGTVIQ